MRNLPWKTVIKVGVFTLVNLVFAFWLIRTIGNLALFADRTGYEAVFDDVTGLLPGDAVKIAGVEVGKVEGITVEHGQAVVDFTVASSETLGQRTQVGVELRNLLGLRYLYVYPAGDGELPGGHRFAGDATLPPADFGRLLNQLNPTLQALSPEATNVTVRALAEALDGREQRVQELLTEAASFTETLAQRDDRIANILENAATLSHAYANRQRDLRRLMTSFSDVATTIADRNDELERVITQLGDGLGELRSFLDRNDVEIRAAVDELDAITSVLAVNHENLEDIVTYLGRGLVGYHRISRWGQWFNIRVTGQSADGQQLQSERGATLPASEQENSDTPGLPAFLRSTLLAPGGSS